MPKLTRQGAPDQSRIPMSLFSTEGLPAAERFAAWRESIGVFLEVRQPDATSPADFSAQVEGYLLEDVFLSRCTTRAQKFDRHAARIAQDSIDHYMIQVFLDGGVEMNRGNNLLRTPQNGVIVFDLGEVMDTFNTDFDVLSLIIPRRRLAPLLTYPDSLQGACVDPDSGAGILFSNFVATLFSVAPTLTPVDASLSVRTLLDLAAMAFNGIALKTGDLPELAQQAELMRVQNYIKERLSSPALEPDSVAEGVGMSRARLYRLFAPIGGVADYIREQRLRRCLADLLSAQHVHRQIADVAYRWGFSDPVSFAKAFKQRFGRTPSEARDAAATLMRRGGDDPRPGNRLYEQWITGLA